jgi:hypothetical protein
VAGYPEGSAGLRLLPVLVTVQRNVGVHGCLASMSAVSLEMNATRCDMFATKAKPHFLELLSCTTALTHDTFH